MPQIHIRIPSGLKKGLDKLRHKTESESRNALIVILLGLFVPDFNYVQFVLFLHAHFPDRVDNLAAEIARYQEEQTNGDH